MAEDNSDLLDTGIDDKDPINKSKFWHSLSTLQKKIAIISGAIVGLGIILKLVWVLFVTASTYETYQTKVDSIQSQQKQFQKYISSQLDSIKIKTLAHIVAINTIQATYMKDYTYKDIVYKLSADSSMYYSNNGILYPVYLDRNSENYYYQDDRRKTEWCK